MRTKRKMLLITGIIIIAVGFLGYWLGYQRKFMYCYPDYEEEKLVAPIPYDRAKQLYENYLRFSSFELSAKALSKMSFPLLIDDAKQGLSDIFAQPKYKDLLLYPGINIDSTGKPFFTVIFIGVDSSGKLITTQERNISNSRVPEQGFLPKLGTDVIQDDNRPCNPCPPSL